MIAGTASAVTVRVASLNNKTGLVAMEIQSVVKPGTRKLNEGSAMQRGVVGKEFEDDVAFRCLDTDAGGAGFVA